MKKLGPREPIDPENAFYTIFFLWIVWTVIYHFLIPFWYKAIHGYFPQ